jgi:DNA-binding SARP family transcriptional activator/tetratricopeptide (TPR) repeat protein
MRRQIHLLGTLSITDDDRPSDLVRNAKGCALLTYLLVRGRSETREHLADLFWDAIDTASSLRNLRVLLTRIRPFLPGLDISRNTLRYQPQPGESVDYLALALSLSQRDAAPPLADLRLYQGELLEGLYLEDAPRFMEWLTLERERLRRAVLDAHRSLCQSLVADKRWQDGAEAAANWLSIDNLDEGALRWRLQFLAATGQLPAAMQAFAAYRQLLWDELGAEPEAATQALVQELAEWSGNVTAVFLPDLSPLEALTTGALADPGPLPANSILPYHRNVDFVGRESDLLQIASRLGDVSDDGRPAVVALTGIGGLGKTQTAVEFCYRYGRYFPGGVFWLNFAEAQNVAEEVATVGSERGLGLFGETDQLTLADRLGRVQRAWQEPFPRLLIFDNCEDEALLATWAPVTGGCRVVATSRQGAWERRVGITAVALNVLNPLESCRLVQRLAAHVSETEAAAIGQEVGHLPLALHLAGSFLRRYRQISPADYIAQMHSKGVLHHPSFQGRGASHSPTGHELHVARTFALSLEQLNPHDEVDQIARRLLTHAACFAPGEPIPLPLLRATISDGDDLMMTLLAEDALARLVALGSLVAEGRSIVVLHRLLAAFVLAEMVDGMVMAAARTAVEDTLVNRLAGHLERARSHGLPPVPIPHLRHVTEVALGGSSAAAAPFALALGRHLREMGEYTRAQDYLEKGLAIAIVSEDSYTQGRIQAVLTRAYFSQGFHQRSERSALEAERLLRLANRSDQEWLIATLTRQGWAHLRQGKPDSALNAAEEARRLSVSTHNETTLADCLNLLGSIHYFLLGEYEAADLFLRMH